MAGLVFINGNLLTQDPARLHAKALAVEGDRIAAVGSRTDVERAVRPGARTVDLGGRTLVPGFNDAHAHAWKLGQLLTQRPRPSRDRQRGSRVGAPAPADRGRVR